MITLVIGGSGSGKSEYAESLCMNEDKTKYYIATMQPFGDEGKKRIERHHALRAGKGFETIECYTRLGERFNCDEYCLAEKKPGVFLLEDLSNLVANEIFSPDGRCAYVLDGSTSWDMSSRLIADELFILSNQCDHLVIVSNNIFEDGTDYDESTKKFMKVLAFTNELLALVADRVVEVVCGIPIIKK